MSRLLADNEPPPFEVTAGRAGSPFVVIVDHAGARVPRALASLGLQPADLARHIAWDLGALGLARHLAEELGAWLIAQNYSRLVIDCNRPLASPESIVLSSEDTVIPGNCGISPRDAAVRADEIFLPYHGRIRHELDERQERGRKSVVVFVHSFTPVFRGTTRDTHVGVLHLEDTRVATPLLAALRREAGLVVGDNEPYRASELTDFSLMEHGLRRMLPHVELEVRQDLLGDERGQVEWALRLARLLKESISFPV